ncbi:IclR family transcriptional regulator [Alicycliphilus sp. T452]
MTSIHPSPEGEDAADSSDGNGDRYFITALARGLEVLACFRAKDRSLSNQEIAKRCNLPKSTITRITYTLTKLGYLTQLDEHGGRFALGIGTLSLGSAMLTRLDIRQLARPLMQELADSTHLAVSLAVRDRLSLIYVEVCRSSSVLGLTLQVGSRIPVLHSAIGRAYMVKTSEAERSDILNRARELDEAVYVDLCDDFKRGLQDYERYGCSTSFGDWQKDVNGIAMAFQPAGGGAMLAINCGGPASQLTPEFFLDIVRPRLQDLVIRLAA